jgi:hypothetical protein
MGEALGGMLQLITNPKNAIPTIGSGIGKVILGKVA